MGKFKPPAKHYSFSKPTSTETVTDTEGESYSTDSVETTVPSHVSSNFEWKENNYQVLSHKLPGILSSSPAEEALSVEYLWHLYKTEVESMKKQSLRIQTFEGVLRKRLWETK